MVLIPSTVLLGLGQGLSITGLVLVMPFIFVYRTYLRFFDHLQLLYLYSLALTYQPNTFSSHLQNSWVEFNKNIFYFCTKGDFVCTAGFPLSFGACLLVFLLLVGIFVHIQARRKKEISFEPVYTFFKGLTRWIYVPLSFWSFYFLIESIKGTSKSEISTIVILTICVIFPLAQLVGYSSIEVKQKQNNQEVTEEDKWRKWLEFASFYRLLLICILVAIGALASNKIPYYFVYAINVVYGFLFAMYHNFYFQIVGRIVFILGQALMIAVFTFFLQKQTYLTSYNLDFIFIGVIFVMDAVYYVVELVVYFVRGKKKKSKIKTNPLQKKDTKNSTKTNNKVHAHELTLNDVVREESSQMNLYGRQQSFREINRKNRYYFGKPK